MTSDRDKFQRALLAQRSERPVGKIDPRRITIALDLRGLYGPEVDEACGVAEPTVDQWETGELTPTPEQLELLADLCGVTPRFFSAEFAPVDLGQGVWVCGSNGCHLTEPDYPADRHALASKVVPLHRETLFR